MCRKKPELLLTLLFLINPCAIVHAEETDTAFDSRFVASAQKDTIEHTADTPSELPRLTVTPEKSMKGAFVTSSSEFKATELLHTAGTGNDINRILALHPSVMSLNSVDNNSLNIRGGMVQENLYTIDGIEFKTINHYAAEVSSGGLGFITADNVDNVRINTIVQPYLKSRNSSVIEIDLKEIPQKKASGQFDLNISGVSLQMQGRHEKQNSSFLTNFRWMDMEPLKMFTRGVWSQFGDLLFKGATSLNEYHSLGMVSVLSYDKTQTKSTWDRLYPDGLYQKKLQQMTAGIYYNYNRGRVQNRITLSVGVDRDNYFQEVTLTGRKPFFVDTLSSVIWIDTTMTWKEFDSHDRSTRGTLNDAFTLCIHKNLSIETGIRAHACEYYYLVKNGRRYNDLIPVGYETGGYIQGQAKISQVKAIAGMRCDYFTTIDKIGIAPYLGLSYDTQRRGSFKFQCTYSYQEPPVLEKFFPWFYIYQESLNDLVLQRCIQSTLLYEHIIRNKHVLSAELYCKYYNQEYPCIYPYEVLFDTQVYMGHGQWRWKITDADGKKVATGFELCLQNSNENIVRYRLAYTMGKVKIRFTDKKWYDDENDIRAGLKVMVAARLKKIHDFSITCLATDGRPYTRIDTITTSQEWFTHRFDPTVFLSARYSLIYTGKKLSFGAYVDIQNILNQRHAIAMQEIDKHKRTERKLDGILPTAGLMVSF